MKLTAHGVQTQYQVIGSGPFLVLLHGWGCDWQIWSPIITTLSEKYAVVLPDLPAFGTSHTTPQVWDTSDYSRWLQDFLRQVVGEKKFSLGGHSFGGKIAAWYAADHSQPQPQKLILIDASGLPDPLSSRKHFQHRVLSLIPETLKAAIPHSVKRRLLTATGSADDHFNSSPAQRAILKKIVHEDLRHKLPQITTPTLVMWGANDADTPLHQGQKFTQLIPGAQLIAFAQSGHFPFIDETPLFVQELQEFLA